MSNLGWFGFEFIVLGFLAGIGLMILYSIASYIDFHYETKRIDNRLREASFAETSWPTKPNNRKG